MKNWLKKLSWLLTAIFVIVVVIPLAAERLVSSREWKSLFTSFQLTDEEGRLHAGFVAWGRVILFDTQFMEYGYQLPEGTDANAWRNRITGIDEENIKKKDGFLWSDSGFLWSHQNLMKVGENIIQEGKRLEEEVIFTDQLEIVLPGAPLDSKTPNASFFGMFPDYKVAYENDDFKFDLVYSARTKGWYLWNEGKPFRTGDFFLGSMNELACNVKGTILHKEKNKQFKVQGTGLFEDAIGLPWSWIEWGAHDWMDIHFPNGWSGALWKAKDDWQWGYNRHPELGWIYDPEMDTFHTFYRVEIFDMEMAKEDLNGFEYPSRARWRAIAKEGTLEVQVKNITLKPRETCLPYTPFSIKMSYGTNAYDARFVRRDGSVVELKNGYGTMEHFMALAPDYRYIGPTLLILVILSWGATAITSRKRENRPVRGPVLWTIICIIAVFCLYFYWSA